MFSTSEENYIKAIYHLQRKGETVSTNALSDRIQTKPASVTDMLKKLKAKKILEYKPYHGVSLTAHGRKVALDIVRRHRLWEFFLVHSLGFEWDAVHEIAEELEHIQHPELVDKLDAFLGRPAFDPHGDPIPDRHGIMANIEYKLLTDAQSGDKVRFLSVGLQTPELMTMLKHKKISLGDSIEVIEKFEFDQSLDVLVNGDRQVSLSYRTARHMLVN
ncbi:MAG TPA: metal-dependent transcriptional regulator [Phnomibacter sp.]|nr:metal-dependent transcriptional regulator [Phnomibacter sp.]